RLYPTTEQEQKLWQSANTARFIYNWTLSKQEENHENGGKFISDEVSNTVAKQSVKDACNAYKNFFKSLANKPKFKSKKKSKPSFYNDVAKLKVKPKSVLIEKVGWIKTKEQLPIDVKYTNPRISYDNKYWYISVGIEVKQPITQLTGESLGIDVGIKDLAICSNEMIFKNINKSKEVRRLKKSLKRKQRQCSRKYEMNKKGKEYVKTKNIAKLEKQIKLIHRKLSNIRLNYIHQVTNMIVKTKPSRVVMEDLNIKGMMKNKHLSKSISEQCLYDFKMKMKYKCEFYGIEFVEADRYYPSSKLCSSCGSIKKDLKFKDRIYKCSCGLSINRDLNASINLSRYKLAS
ncbi:MAG: transposase, partial [Clostridium sp.]|nr:transposase [Clostridium sp.]